MKFALLLIYCLLSTTSVSTDDDSDRIWQEYKLTFQKSYSDGEEAERRKVFELNHRMIKQHNEEADIGLHSYWLKPNHMSDRSHEELDKIHSCVFNHDFEKITPLGTTYVIHKLYLPKAIDWREKNIVTEVKDQDTCGGCWAFATIGAVESHLAKKTGKLVTLSEQNLIDCVSEEDGCDGGTLTDGFEYIIKNKGIDTQKSYPFESKKGQCRFSMKNVAGTVKDYVCIHKSEDYVRRVVATIGPVAAAIHATEPKFFSYGHGIYSSDACNKSVNHGVVIVGYGEKNDEKYWILKNSWSDHWGMNGYMYLKRDAPYMCHIGVLATYPIV